MRRREELWERYKRLIREERYAEAKSIYRKYLKATDPKMHLWRANFTLTKWKAWPRTMTPFLMNFPGFRRFNRRIIIEIEEAKRRLGGASPSPPRVERIRPPGARVSVLFASSDYEPVTHAGTLWHDTYVIPEIERLGYRDKHLRDPAAQRPIYDMLLESDFTTGCGHGGETVYTGGLQQPLLELGDYVGKYDVEAIQGMGFKYLSCLLGAKLLPQLVEDGAKLAQGYEKSYAFSWDPKYGFTKPENDPILRLFFLPYVRSVIGLLNGMSNKEAFELERKQYLVNAERATDPEVRDLLIREADIMVMFGDPNAKIAGP